MEQHKSRKNKRKRHQKNPAMPQRPRQHELDTEAVTFFISKLPPSWTWEEVKRDYGKDLIVEIFENREATALEFRVQSKGHEDFTIRHKDQIIQPLKVSTLNYYDQLALPVLLVAYSSKQKRACYLWIKPYIYDVLDKEQPDWREIEGESEISIRIPLSNALDRTAKKEIYNHVETETVKIRVVNGGNFQFTNRQNLNYREFPVSTRLLRPKITNYLHRSRLTDFLDVTLSQKSVFIQADAGYGKTWLLQDFIHAKNPQGSIWYTFTKGSLDAPRFVREIAAELVRQANQIGLETLHFIEDRGKDSRTEEAIAMLIGEVASSPTTPILLLLEDLHNVNDSVLHSCILDLVRSRPNNLQIILTSRLPLPEAQAKLIGQGLLAPLEQAALSFTLDETRDYLKSVLALDLSPDQVQLLQERTGGWIAAIGLAIEVLQDRPSQSEDLFHNLTGFNGNIYDFFAQEVYDGLAPGTKKLLKRLSITRLIQPETVNVFTKQTGGGQVLKDLARHNTFLVQDQENVDHYQLHPLFAEFLLARFRDEEGSDTILQAHHALATFFLSRKEWYAAAEHATEAKDWGMAIQSLEEISPIGVSLGYGEFTLTWIDKLPKEERNRSPLLCEMAGLSALQIGNLERAAQEFDQAWNLYSIQQDQAALNRLEYYSAEVALDRGTLPPEDFLRVTNKVSLWSYKHNEIVFGVQIEQRLIDVGQTLTFKYSNLLVELAQRSETLIKKIEALGSDYEIIKAKVLSSQAHLLFQVVSLTFQQEAGKIQLREQLGHPVDMVDRKAQAKATIEGISEVWRLFDQAEKITKGKSEIEWAMIHRTHLKDMAHHMSQFLFLGLLRNPQLPNIEIGQKEKDAFFQILAEFDKCAQIFSKYHSLAALAEALCDAADIYDVFEDAGNRDRLAQEAFKIATDSGFSDAKERAQDLLQNRKTFSSTFKNASASMDDQGLANMSEEEKTALINVFLRAFSDSTDTDKMREAVTSDVNDMIAGAKKRLEWCRHVEIIQDLRHTRSLETMYKKPPQKRIVCRELMFQSPNPGYSFDELWPMFEGVYCLGCTSRSLGLRNVSRPIR